MKIVAAKTFVVGNPEPGLGGRYFAFIKLTADCVRTWSGFHAEILKPPIRWEDGFVIPPTAPGLGVELDEAVAEQHPYEGNELHLVPADDPVA